MGRKLSNLLNSQKYPFLKKYVELLFLSAALLLVGQIAKRGFISVSNLNNLLSVTAILTVAGIAQAIAIISGGSGINLAIGALMSMGALVGSSFLTDSGFSIVITLAVLGLCAVIAGTVIGVGIQYFHIPPLVMTLIMTFVVDGFTLAYTRGMAAGGVPPWLRRFGYSIFGPISWMVIAAVVCVVVGICVLRYTQAGRQLYMVGCNRMAALISGIHVNRTVIISYIISCLLAAYIGFLYLGYVGTAQLKMAADYSMLSVAAAVVGGVKISGGEGSMIGVALGAFLLTIITNLLMLFGMTAGARELINGFILLMILLFSARGQKLRL